MLEKIRKHFIKIIVFAVNISLVGTVVFIIREKDKERLAEKEASLQPATEAAESQPLQEELENQPITEENIPENTPVDPGKAQESASQTPAAPSDIQPNPIPANKTPTSAQKTKPADRKTKTS